MELPQRKHPRLKHYDYSQNGCYFLTLCTKDKACILGNVMPDTNGFPSVSLSPTGQTVLSVICEMANHSSDFQIDNFVIMPNHLHLLLTLDDSGGQQSAASSRRPAVGSQQSAASNRRPGTGRPTEPPYGYVAGALPEAFRNEAVGSIHLAAILL